MQYKRLDVGRHVAMWVNTQWRIEFDFEKSEDFHIGCETNTLSAEVNVVVGPGQGSRGCT